MTPAATAIRAPVADAWGDVRSRSIWRWQLIFAASAATAVVIYALLSSSIFEDVTFVVGTLVILAMTGVSLVLPWHRATKAAVLLLPIGDALAVSMMSQGGESRASLLWVFPVAWVATYYRMPSLMLLLGVIAATLATDVVRTDFAADQVQRALIILLCFGFMGFTVNFGAQRARAYRVLLRRQLDQVERVRLRAEQQARRTSLLADTLETGIALVDGDGVLLDANLAFLDVYGADSIEGFSSTAVVEYDDHRGAAVSPDSTIIAQAARGARRQDARTWIYDHEGKWRALDVTTRTVASGTGETGGTLVVLRDVTAGVEAERDRENVATIVSHELRNPLTAVTGHVELMLERVDLPDDVTRQLRIVENAGQRMERLITSTLDRYRALPPVRERVTFRSLAEESIAAYAAAARSSQVELGQELTSECPVDADAFALRQAIDNVIGNAIKYTGRGGNVRVVLRERDGVALLTVSDDGIGMSDDDVDRIFERGYRAPAATASGLPGSGLGMAQVLESVTELGGRAHVASSLGRGSAVTLEVPLAGPEGVT